MGQRFSAISDRHRAFIEAQRIFFVASAAPEGRVNVSPKGMATFRVLGPNEAAYLDCTGSGSETARTSWPLPTSASPSCSAPSRGCP